jgi:hypothetical protein
MSLDFPEAANSSRRKNANCGDRVRSVLRSALRFYWGTGVTLLTWWAPHPLGPQLSSCVNRGCGVCDSQRGPKSTPRAAPGTGLACLQGLFSINFFAGLGMDPGLPQPGGSLYNARNWVPSAEPCLWRLSPTAGCRGRSERDSRASWVSGGLGWGFAVTRLLHTGSGPAQPPASSPGGRARWPAPEVSRVLPMSPPPAALCPRDPRESACASVPDPLEGAFPAAPSRQLLKCHWWRGARVPCHFAGAARAPPRARISVLEVRGPSCTPGRRLCLGVDVQGLLLHGGLAAVLVGRGGGAPAGVH